MKLSQKRAISYAYLAKRKRYYDELLTRNNLWESFKQSKYKSKIGYLRSLKLL